MAYVIDADTHVDESEATWEAAAKYAPMTVGPMVGGTPAAEGDPRGGRFWLVDNRLQARAVRDEIHHPPLVARELRDVQVRLADMDRMDVDVQVIFPTFFIRYDSSPNPSGELALTSSYNRWLAERCDATNGRLRWVAMLPWLNTDRAVEELRWAKEHGAIGFFKRGFDLGKRVNDPYFFPIYEAANDLDVPVCVHTGHPGFPSREWDRGYPVMSAFSAIVTSQLPSRFPNLRFGFIEAGASWLPYVLSQLEIQLRSRQLHEQSAPFAVAQDLFRTNRLYVALDPVDDIEYLLTLGTEDNLMIGTDYCHSDVSANRNALAEVQGWADSGRIAQSVARKILDTNARVFYGLPRD